MLPSRSLREKVLCHLIWNVDQQRRLTSRETDKNNVKTKEHQIKKNGCRRLPFSSRQITPDPERQFSLKSPTSSLLLSAFEICGSCQSFGMDVTEMCVRFFSLKKKKKLMWRRVLSVDLWLCFSNNRRRREVEETIKATSSWEVKVHILHSDAQMVRESQRLRGCVCVCRCVCASASLSLRGMAATWRRSWSGPEGGRGTRWWRSRAAGGRSRPPAGLPRDSAARWCSCKTQRVLRAGRVITSRSRCRGKSGSLSPVYVLLGLLYGINGTLKFTEVRSFFPQPAVVFAFVSCNKKMTQLK